MERMVQKGLRKHISMGFLACSAPTKTREKEGSLEKWFWFGPVSTIGLYFFLSFLPVAKVRSPLSFTAGARTPEEGSERRSPTE